MNSANGARLELHPEVHAELQAAAFWYDERQAELGDRFLERVDEALNRISMRAAAYPVWPGTGRAEYPIRKALVEQFPYAIAFEVQDELLLVLAIAHVKRRPLYWLARSTGGDERP